MNDADTRATYAAEDLVMDWLDAVDPATGAVDVVNDSDGPGRHVSFVPETEPRFSHPDEVGVFVAKVLERLQSQARQFGSNYRKREQRPVEVVALRGFTRATYRDGTIALPTCGRGGAWALRGLVVLHELAHHLNTGVDGAIIDEHGPGFRATFLRLLEDLGWVQIAAMVRLAHQQCGLDATRPMVDGMLAKIGKLLRHAEGASNEAERDAFFAKAQELATTHSIGLAVARAAHADVQTAASPTFEDVRLGHRGQQSNVRFIALILAIARANDLRCTIRGDNTGVTLYGFSSDIDAVKTLYVGLVVQMVADADVYIRSGAHRPAHGRTARTSFYAGWTQRIGERLLEAQHSAQLDLGVFEASGHNPTALVLASKELEVNDYYASKLRQQRVRRSWRGGGAVSDLNSVGHGRVAAERARLGDQKSLPS